MRERSLGAAYEAAHQDLGRRQRSLESARDAHLSAQSETPIFDTIDYQVQKWLTGRAEKKLARLRIQGGEEAAVAELNKEYERLRANAEQSIRALKMFERTKLGVSDENEIEA